MTLRLFAMLVAISLGSWVLAAVERATFVLTNGERVSGSVVFHGVQSREPDRQLSEPGGGR